MKQQKHLFVIIVVSLLSLIFLFIKNVEKAAVIQIIYFLCIIIGKYISIFYAFDPKYKKQFNNCIVKILIKIFQ